jgi:transposase
MGHQSKAELQKLVQTLEQRLAEKEAENQLLRQKIDLLSRRIFGKSSEQLDPGQLELLFQLEKLPPGKSEASSGLDDLEEAAPASTAKARRKKSTRRAERIPENLPVVEEVIDPAEVLEQPENWRCIGEEVSEQLDYEPARFLRRRVVRRKFVAKKQIDAVPVIAPLPPVLQERCLAAPGLLAQIVVAKFCDHLPLYRQEQIFLTRHGIELSRQTMARWMDLVADWLRPIYELIRSGVMAGGYVQIDESPIRYLAPGHGSTKLGYFWTSSDPRGNVFYHWETGRGTDCLSRIVPADFIGTVQTDGYAAYARYASSCGERIKLAGCWAHARRKFVDAKEQAPQMAGFILRQVQLLYRVERELRAAKAGADKRTAVRASQSCPIYARIGKLLNRLQESRRYLPQSLMGRAITYALSNWELLGVYLGNGRVEIDNNIVENAIRPTALGKKNWLFIGDAAAGERSAIIYTVVENCRRLQIDPFLYIREVLTRLPAMTNWQVHTLLPETWKRARQEREMERAA